MVVGAAEGFVLRVDVVAHEHGAEMVANFLEIQLHYVVFFDLVQIAIDLLIDGTYFLQFSQFQSTRILATCQVGLMVECLLLDLVDFFEFFEFPLVVILLPPIQASLAYYYIRKVVVGELAGLDVAHEDSL